MDTVKVSVVGTDVPPGEGGYACTECGKSFNRKQRLLLHIKYVHEGAEPLQCEQCDRSFLRKEDLARHQLLHSGIKGEWSYVHCQVCRQNPDS